MNEVLESTLTCTPEVQSVTEDALARELGGLALKITRLQRLREFILRRSELTPRERLALDILTDLSPMAMTELAEQCRCTKSTMTSVIERLVRRGYVRREQPEWNRRSVLVHITDAGREVAEEHRETHYYQAREMLAGLSPSERVLLVKAYHKLVDSLINEVQSK